METHDVVDVISSIPIGTIVAWGTVIATIVTVAASVAVKLYKLFEKNYRIKEDVDSFKEMVKKHDEQMKSISDSLLSIQEKIDKQEQSEFTKLRYNIVRAGEEYIAKGEVTIRQLRVLEELFDDYSRRNGNSYVKTLMDKVRGLLVIGKLDEDGNDIE